jgi:hypothetical protein
MKQEIQDLMTKIDQMLDSFEDDTNDKLINHLSRAYTELEEALEYAATI